MFVENMSKVTYNLAEGIKCGIVIVGYDAFAYPYYFRFW